MKDDVIKIKFIRGGKAWLQVNRDSKNGLVRLIVGSLYFGRRILSWIKCLIYDENFRTIQYMKVFKAKRLQQTTPMTAMNRYPVIFSGCLDYFEGNDNIKILSYGCSTGEEVLTLRQYFPNATIVGAEINEHSLKRCRNHEVDEKIKFVKSTPRKIMQQGPFDLIFCMAVLQRTPHQVTEQGVTNLKKIYPFEKFEKQIVELDGYLNPGGLMVIHFSQYYFADTKVASAYQALGNYNQDDYVSAIFDKNSELIQEKISRKSVFIKKR